VAAAPSRKAGPAAREALVNGLQIGGALAGIITGVSVLCGGALWVATKVRRYWEKHFVDQLGDYLGEFLGDWKGEPARAGVEARPGVMESIASLRQQVAAIQAETRPNGGASLRDAVVRIETEMTAHRQATGPAIAGLREDVAALRRRMELFETERVERDITRWPEQPEQQETK
jgi:hypothetical protein